MMRSIILALTLMASLGAAQPTPTSTRPHEAYLSATELIDTGHPAIQTTAARLTHGKKTERDKAIAIHDFVRDNIAYGFGPKFYDHTASEVLRSRRGFCNPKGTLFIALLRASGIPARQHFVEISPEILHGIVSPRTEWLDHSYTEVWLDGQWLPVDSYIVDPLLFAGAQKRLQAENRELGYAAHRRGSLNWDGKSPNFSQFVSAPPRVANRDFGIHADVQSFYSETPAASNRMDSKMRTFFRLATSTLNGRLHELRSEGKTLSRGIAEH
jgi:transglutaminase-like putative cysteine protease